LKGKYREGRREGEFSRVSETLEEGKSCEPFLLYCY
jgi:hypothetical protein